MSLLRSITTVLHLFVLSARALPLSDDRVANQTSFESSNDVDTYFRQQGTNPYGVVAVLLLVGGDVIQKAMAQQTGSKTTWFTPVVFSFGWVSYAFQCLASAMGSHVYMPQPEYSSWVVNIESGDRRENRSWLLGRLLRDLELKNAKAPGAKGPLLVTVYRLSTGTGIPKPKHPKRDWLWNSYWVVVIVQLFVASIPIWVHDWQDYSILVIVGAGNVLALISASLSTMRKEKFQGSSKGSNSSYALTRGNGHPHVFLILPNDIGETNPGEDHSKRVSKMPYLDQMATARYQAGNWRYLLTDFPLAIFWVFLLIFVGNLNSHAWVLVGAGMLGTIHNVLVSAWPRDPAAHGIPLKKYEYSPRKTSFTGRSVMEVLRNVERKFPGAGHSLRPIFFPGRETKANKDLWKEDEVKFSNLTQRRKARRELIYQNGGNVRREESGTEHCCCAEECSCPPAPQPPAPQPPAPQPPAPQPPAPQPPAPQPPAPQPPAPQPPAPQPPAPRPTAPQPPAPQPPAPRPTASQPPTPPQSGVAPSGAVPSRSISVQDSMQGEDSIGEQDSAREEGNTRGEGNTPGEDDIPGEDSTAASRQAKMGTGSKLAANRE